MSHHLLPDGRFQSDKHPDLPPDRIRINFTSPLSWRALAVLADDYECKDPELAADIRARLAALGYKHETFGDYVLGRNGRPVARMLVQTPHFGGCCVNADEEFRNHNTVVLPSR